MMAEAGNNGRCLLISGGHVDQKTLTAIRESGPFHVVIAADAGLQSCLEADLLPDHIVGDFDSLPDADALLARCRSGGSVIHRYRPEKDLTDTQIGVELAMRLGCTRVEVLGATGTRLDHFLGNLQVMELALDRGVKMVITDAHNRIHMHREAFRIRQGAQWGKYISLIPWGSDVTGLTLRGFRYPLTDALLPRAGSLGISNELTEAIGEVFLTGGTLIVIESRD